MLQFCNTHAYNLFLPDKGMYYFFLKHKTIVANFSHLMMLICKVCNHFSKYQFVVLLVAVLKCLNLNFLIHFYSLFFKESEWNLEAQLLKWKCVEGYFPFSVNRIEREFQLMNYITWHFFYPDYLKIGSNIYFDVFFFLLIARAYRNTGKYNSIFCYKNKYYVPTNLMCLQSKLTSEMSETIFPYSPKNHCFYRKMKNIVQLSIIEIGMAVNFMLL